MGVIALPASGVVYLDANSIIYTVEKHATYGPLLAPLWLAAQAKTFEAISSEISLLECLVVPLRRGDAALVKDYERALLGTELRLLSITQSILCDSAQLRATTNLKSPDAIHAATAKQVACALFVTNDGRFRSITGLNVVILDDLLKP